MRPQRVGAAPVPAGAAPTQQPEEVSQNPRAFTLGDCSTKTPAADVLGSFCADAHADPSFEAGSELCCSGCLELRYVGAGAGVYEPRCGQPVCAVEVPALRELEAQIELAAEYLAGSLRTCVRGDCQHLTEALSEAITIALEESYESAHVGYTVIRLAVVQGAQERRRHER